MASPYYALAFGALALARRHVPRSVWLLLLPAAWVSAELLRAHLGLRATWANVGDAFVEWPRLRQIAELTGVYGVSALVVLGNAVVAESLRVAWAMQRGRPANLRPLALPAGVFAALLLCTLIYGDGRLRALREQQPAAPGLKIALVQGNMPQKLRWQRATASRVLHRYGSLTREALRLDAPPDLIVWPENAIQTDLDDPTYGPPLLRLVEQSGVTFILGAPRSARKQDARLHFNSAFLLAPGTAPQHYDKQHLLPFSETDPFGDWFPQANRGDLHASSYTEGNQPGMFQVLQQPVGVLICFEAIYAHMARELAASGAQMLFNLTNDGWFRGRGASEQHLHQVVYRAIETRLPVVRATTTGVSAVIAPSGEIVDRLERDETGALHARVHLRRPRPTFYVRFGDVFALSCLGFLSAAAAIATYRSARGRRFWFSTP
jgi:apolipoprotein N-acyltransferase